MELGKPATSAGSERTFSSAGFLIQCRRNRLSARTVDNMLFLNSYLANKYRKFSREFQERFGEFKCFPCNWAKIQDLVLELGSSKTQVS
ncbi:E3 SUMO-protein ligase ZBED1 [Frankliniella fusca]|uniref:E3 SUMO-protein ligase ZBED1 n=1 Tax=Frankliniella fusca TaxID=407009 RepID=A0AAE1LS77_9NEOP|nr:E3 SUMO-protein ligase ZBED1 [Frankliniella fusca]